MYDIHQNHPDAIVSKGVMSYNDGGWQEHFCKSDPS